MPSTEPGNDDAARCDVLVVGGGINGVGIARDLAGRGLSVVLVERDDLASHTSSASTKLLHGGLRYLEQRAFGLVRKALVEREILLASAPHIAWPMRFVVPHEPALRPAWLIRLGLFLYDRLASGTLPKSTAIDLRSHVAGRALNGDRRLAFCYSDGWVDDARLVVLNAVDAHERGAVVRTRTACIAATRSNDAWHARLQTSGGGASTVVARALVNATGPWAARFLHDALRARTSRALRLVRGSHIVVATRFDHPFAYLLQSADRRVVFAIPYEREFTLIGTTDVEVHEPGAGDTVDGAEVDYLCAQASRWFREPVTRADVVWRYAGVRPLVDDAASSATNVTRDYALDLDRDGAPLLTAWGGKLTTYRRLAEDAAGLLCTALGHDGRAWTAPAALPGGDLAYDGEVPAAAFARFLATLRSSHAWLPGSLAVRLARGYGSRTLVLLGGASRMVDLGAEVAPGLHERELRYLVDHEWARTADDVLWRRTKLGLHIDDAARTRVAAWLAGSAAGRLRGDSCDDERTLDDGTPLTAASRVSRDR